MCASRAVSVATSAVVLCNLSSWPHLRLRLCWKPSYTHLVQVVKLQLQTFHVSRISISDVIWKPTCTEAPAFGGYARVSMSDQNNERQIAELIRYGVDPRDIFEDKASGRNMQRPGWRDCWRDIRAGDVLVVQALDRLGAT